MAPEERWAPSDVAEKMAQRVLEARLGCELVGVAPADHPTVECRTSDWTKAFEVKQLTSQKYVELSNASDREQTSWDSDVLTWRWGGILTAPSLSDLYKPIPPFPDDPPPEETASYAAIGRHVLRTGTRRRSSRR